MMKEQSIQDATKILQLDYTSNMPQSKKPPLKSDINVQKFRMPTPTHQDPSKIMAGGELALTGTRPSVASSKLNNHNVKQA